MTIAILGSGAFGTALAVALAANGGRVLLFSRSPARTAQIARDRSNPDKLPGITLPGNVVPTADPADLVQATTILSAVPAQETAALLHAVGPFLSGAPVVLCAKGVERGTMRLQTAIAADLVHRNGLAALTGPGFAAEIAAGKPTALTLACADPALGSSLQSILSTNRMRLYLTRDIVGAQLGGALKNVIALACGMSVGADLGESARAALMTRGFAEMSRLAMAMGARSETLTGLSGLGDLALTCTSTQSRNFANGYALGAGHADTSGATVEGIATAVAACELAKSHGIDMPIALAVTAVLDGQVTIAQAMELLLNRPLRSE